jgi:tRNA modification GTPase
MPSTEQRRIDVKMREHALRALEQSDHVVLVRDATDLRPPLALPRAPDLTVWSKVDLLDGGRKSVDGSIHVSAKTGEGFPAFHEILDRLCFGESSATSFLALNARHVQAIEEARTALSDALAQIDAGPEFIALELRVAVDALGRITGHISPDDLLGRIFSAFCIGK